MILHGKHIQTAGADLKNADRILLMLHGRGGSAADILSLGNHLNTKGVHLIAPEAAGRSWYPYSFLAPVENNEPDLSNSISLLHQIMSFLFQSGVKSEQLFILGFSQGACLALEFSARYAQPFGGIVAFTGGLIGETINETIYNGNFKGTKVFIGNSDHDPHVPLTRSEASKTIMEQLGADVTLSVFPGMPHTINKEEIDWVNNNLLT